MSGFRASSSLSIPPKQYGPPKGHYYKGLDELSRFQADYGSKEGVFEEYLDNKSLQPSRHREALSKSSGLLELHYDTMRKKERERSMHSSAIRGPTMDRPFAATAGYSGHIPGKVSNNVIGCTWKNGSALSHETRGKFYKPPMSGVTFTFASASRSASSPSLR